MDSIFLAVMALLSMPFVRKAVVMTDKVSLKWPPPQVLKASELLTLIRLGRLGG